MDLDSLVTLFVLVIAILIAGGIALGPLREHSAKLKPVVIDTAKLPPIRPGPPNPPGPSK